MTEFFKTLHFLKRMSVIHSTLTDEVWLLWSLLSCSQLASAPDFLAWSIHPFPLLWLLSRNEWFGGEPGGRDYGWRFGGERFWRTLETGKEVERCIEQMLFSSTSWKHLFQLLSKANCSTQSPRYANWTVLGCFSSQMAEDSKFFHSLGVRSGYLVIFLCGYFSNMDSVQMVFILLYVSDQQVQISMLQGFNRELWLNLACSLSYANIFNS